MRRRRGCLPAFLLLGAALLLGGGREAHLGRLLPSLARAGVRHCWGGSAAGPAVRRPIRAAQAVESEEDGDTEGSPFTGESSPFVGRRLRVWFEDEDGQPDSEYGSVVEVHGEEGMDQEVAVEWDSGAGRERLRLADLPRVEWLGEDTAADLVANLKELRQESIEGAEEAGTTSIAMSVEHLQKEVEALRWMREELAARAAEAENLRRINAELKAQREEFRQRYGDLVEDSKDSGQDG